MVVPTSSAEPRVTRGKQQSRRQMTSFRSCPSRQLTLPSPRQSSSIHHQLPLSQAKKVHTKYQNSLAFLGIYSESRTTTLQPFSPSDLHQYAAFPPTTQHQEPPQQPAQPPSSHPSPSSSSRPTALACNWFFSGPLL